MPQLGVSARMSRVASMGIRAKVMGLAGLGLCALPCVVLILIGRDVILISGLGPLLAIGSATLAAIATLIGLDLILRPVSLTGIALGRLLGGGTPTDLPPSRPGPEGRLMSDAQRVIDELIALRAEQTDIDGIGGSIERGILREAMQTCRNPAQAVIVVRLTDGAVLPVGADRQDPATQILAESTRRLRAHYGDGVAVAAIGPAELCFVLPLQHADMVVSSDFTQALDSVLSDLGRPILGDEFQVVPEPLTGVATWAQGDPPDKAIDQAIAALRSTTLATPIVVYNDDVRDRANHRAALGQELRSAIRNEEFELYYQPVMDIGTNRPVGAEALIRWHSPDRGFVAPDVFIPLAETSGMIDPIGLWVLREACRAAAGWDPSMRVAINLGARQFLDEDLTWHVSEAIKAAGIRPDQLEIELTEAVAMVDHAHTRTTLIALRDMGVQIAIEDFGTGLGNMGLLHKLPFTTFKIDRQFVTDVHRTPGSQAICEALIALGSGLGLRVVAEGTELAEEVAFLSGRGCALFQGYYFARPVPAHVLGATFDNLGLRRAG